MHRNRAIAAALALTAVIGIGLWWFWQPSDERAIRRRLDAFADDFNTPAGGALGSVAHAARLSEYFAENVRVDLGPGTAPIEGRTTLIGMAVRLQPRTASFELALEDVTVELVAPAEAAVSLTAMFRRRSVASGEESLDAREFSLGMSRQGGEWIVHRVTMIETFR